MRGFLVSVCIAALTCLVVTPAPARAAEMVDGIAAVVNGEVITIGDLDKELEERMSDANVPDGYSMDEIRAQGRRMLLESMINDILVRQEAEALGLEVSQVDIENTIRKVRDEKGLTVEEFRNQLALRNMTREKYTEVIRNQLLKQRLLGYMVHHRVVVTDRELADYVRRNNMGGMGMDDFGLGEMQGMMGFEPSAPAAPAVSQQAPSSKVSLSIIILGSQSDADNLRSEVVSGQRNFADAAKKYSQGPGADSGGSLGEMSLAELGAPIRNAVSQISPGEVSEVFKLAEQYAFVKLDSAAQPAAEEPEQETAADESAEETTVAAEPSPESVLSGMSESEIEHLRKRLHQKKLEERFKEYMQQLRDKAVIRINL